MLPPKCAVVVIDKGELTHQVMDMYRLSLVGASKTPALKYIAFYPHDKKHKKFLRVMWVKVGDEWGAAFLNGSKEVWCREVAELGVFPGYDGRQWLEPFAF